METVIKKKFSISQLDCIILALINTATPKLGDTIKKYLKSMSTDLYVTCDETVRIDIINKLSKIVIKSKETDRSVIIGLSKFDNEECQTIFNNLANKQPFEKPYTKEILQDIVDEITDSITFRDIYAQVENISEIRNRMLTEHYTRWSELSDSCSAIIKDISKNCVSLTSSDNTINCFNTVDYVSRLKKYADEQKNASGIIKTGIRMLNDNILGGGFRPDRLYVVQAPAKNGKSLFLQDCCIWAVKYNDLYAKDSTKRPVVLYMSFENGISDFNDRMLIYASGHNNSEDYTDDDFYNAATATVNKTTGCSIQFEYRPNESMTVSDIDTFITELENDGVEVVMLIADYIGRIRPSDKKADRRFQLSEISNELRNIATSRHIPVLTAAQSNRTIDIELDAASTFEAKCEVAKHIGISTIGDSLAIAQNCDLMLAIARLKDIHINEERNVIEYVDDYLFVKPIADRIGKANIPHIFHRYENGAKPIEDINEATSASIINFTTVIENKVTQMGIKLNPNSTRRL